MKTEGKKKPMFLIIDQRELVALSQVSHECLALYLVLKSKANFKTGVVAPFAGGVITLCDLGSLIERRIKGAKRKEYSSQDVHRLLDRLVKVGLIANLSVCKVNGVTLKLNSGDGNSQENATSGCDIHQASAPSTCSKGVSKLPIANAQQAGVSEPYEFSGSYEPAAACATNGAKLCVENPESPAESRPQAHFSNVFSNQESKTNPNPTPPQPPASRGGG